MTTTEAVEMMKAKLECMTRDVSGIDQDCNAKNCDECNLCYAQGNMGEQKEWLRMGIEALEQEPCEDAISRQAAIRIAEQGQVQGYEWQFKKLIKLPSVTPQSKTGHWIIDINDKDYCFCQFCRHKFDIDRLKMVWGVYELPPHCPNCGAELKGESND